MATWETEKGVSSFDANSAINYSSSTRDSNRMGAASTTSKSGAGWFGLGGYSVVGLNVGSIDTMRNAIRTWVANIQTHLNEIEPLANAANAYKSDDNAVEMAVADYVSNVKQYCMNLVSDLLAFSDKLEDVKRAWMETTGNLAGTITSDTRASDAGSAYQEQL